MGFKFKKIFVLVLILTLLFLLVFPGKVILPQTFSLGPITIHYYGVIMALAIAASFSFARKRAQAFGIGHKIADDLIFWLILGGFLGARIFHVFSMLDYYSANPSEIIKVWHGGLAIYGAIVGGVLTLLLFKKIKVLRLSIFDLLDWLTPSLLIGQAIGRFGNLFNYEALGFPTQLPWKMFVPLKFRPERFVDTNFFQPWFLYDSLACLLIFVILLRIWPKEGLKGRLFFSYLILYNVMRFALEFLRIDGTLSFTTAISLSLGIAGVIFYIYLFKHAEQP